MLRKSDLNDIRRNRRTKHPCIIVGEDDDYYYVIGITHSKETRISRFGYIIFRRKFKKNPDPKDIDFITNKPRKSYYEEFIELFNKKDIQQRIKRMKISELDKNIIREFIDSIYP